MFLKRKTKKKKKKEKKGIRDKEKKEKNQKNENGGRQSANPATIKPTGSRRPRPSSHLSPSLIVIKWLKVFCFPK